MDMATYQNVPISFHVERKDVQIYLECCDPVDSPSEWSISLAELISVVLEREAIFFSSSAFNFSNSSALKRPPSLDVRGGGGGSSEKFNGGGGRGMSYTCVAVGSGGGRTKGGRD
nr:unnamed protein product [Callosobruchus analis]